MPRIAVFQGTVTSPLSGTKDNASFKEISLENLNFMWQDDLIGVDGFVNVCLNKVNPLYQGGGGGGSASDQPGVVGRDAILFCQIM